MLPIMLFIFALWGEPLAAEQVAASPTMLTLGPIDSESDDKNSVITIRFQTKPGFESPKVEAFGSFIQVTLPNTFVPRPGVFVDTKSPYVRKMAAFQLDEQTAGLRLFTTKEAAHLVSSVSTDILENRVIVVLDHAAAERSLLAHFDGVPVAGGPSSEEIVQRTEVRSDVVDPMSALAPQATLEKEAEVKNDEVAPLKIEKKVQATPVPDAVDTASSEWGEELNQKLIAVTIFLGAMLVLLLGLKTWRRLASKKWPLAPEADYSLKTLASHAIGPKQKITVVQVGGEQILIGVSPDSINFLTSLKKSNESNAVASTYESGLLSPRNLVPTPKRQPLLDEATPRSPVRGATRKTEKLPEPGSSIAYGISDQGIKNYRGNNQSDSESNTVDDVTKLIRKKLRDLPKV